MRKAASSGIRAAGSRSRRQHGYCGPRGGSNEKIYCKTFGQPREESFGSKIELLTATPCRTAEWQAVDPSRPCRMSRTSWARQAAESGGIVIGGGGRRYG